MAIKLFFTFYRHSKCWFSCNVRTSGFWILRRKKQNNTRIPQKLKHATTKNEVVRTQKIFVYNVKSDNFVYVGKNCWRRTTSKCWHLEALFLLNAERVLCINGYKSRRAKISSFLGATDYKLLSNLISYSTQLNGKGNVKILHTKNQPHILNP